MTIAYPRAEQMITSSPEEYFAATSRVADAFFTERANDIATACQAMASAFRGGGRMFVCGDGAQRSDVAHVVVEFLHPVVVGKRALPAFALPHIELGAALQTLNAMARAGDVLLLLAVGPLSPSARDVLLAGRNLGLTTILLAGEWPTESFGAAHAFAVPSRDPCIVQETHEMLYHILWELVHVFLDHRTEAEGNA
jgi:D-sedoheptulose 7-phosphate isomerase